ncbi:methyltransferase domain-containing protein [Candidatus Nanohalovita haloferacivicina]|uniref:methyltransferase domain-containing protein n=1 Tax=Candidatus Nanohalovita haloferacivicina TaxID=2978046 RepID=UPI00325FD21A|nr:tRNA (guanine10-N2)-dimethyltransferase [Candidatus Nanohalobia archaeon BNXNv]
MTYTYLLAGENLELAEAELKGFLRSQEIEEDPKREGRTAETEKHPEQLKRLGLTHEVTKKICETKLDKLEIDYRPEKSFSVRVQNLTDEDFESKELEKQIGQKISTEENSVDLENPDEKIKAYYTGEKLVIGKIVQEVDRGLYQQRANQERPFSSPISLDPVLARVLVNLSEVSAGEKLLDPFCGTGGILIEAGLCGIGVYGLDIQKEMVDGCQRNLENYGVISHDIRQGDVAEINETFEEEFNAVVTDLPYGKASKKPEKAVESFIEFLEDYSGKAVFMYNEKEVGPYSADFEVYVHKSLTRYIFIV